MIACHTRYEVHCGTTFCLITRRVDICKKSITSSIFHSTANVKHIWSVEKWCIPGGLYFKWTEYRITCNQYIQVLYVSSYGRKCSIYARARPHKSCEGPNYILIEAWGGYSTGLDSRRHGYSVNCYKVC